MDPAIMIRFCIVVEEERELSGGSLWIRWMDSSFDDEKR
jgi:hypothetical protein